MLICSGEAGTKTEEIEMNVQTTTDVRVWPDGEWQFEDEEPYSWKSDDYYVLEIPDTYWVTEDCDVERYISQHERRL